MPTGEEEGKWKGTSTHWVLYLEGFKGWVFSKVLGKDLNRIIHQFFQVCPLRAVVSTNWSVPGQGIISH